MEYIWTLERVELVQLATVHRLQALGLTVPRGEPCPEVHLHPTPLPLHSLANFFVPYSPRRRVLAVCLVAPLEVNLLTPINGTTVLSIYLGMLSFLGDLVDLRSLSSY